MIQSRLPRWPDVYLPARTHEHDLPGCNDAGDGWPYLVIAGPTINEASAFDPRPDIPFFLAFLLRLLTLPWRTLRHVCHR